MNPLVLTDWTAVDPTVADEYVGTVLANVSDLEFALWVIVFWALVLDVALTIYGLSIGLVERNPVMRHAIESFGLAALGIAKVVAVAIAIGFRVTWPEYALFAPLGLAVPWVLAVAFNVALLASL